MTSPKLWEMYGVRVLNQASFKMYAYHQIMLKLTLFVAGIQHFAYKMYSFEVGNTNYHSSITVVDW